MIEGARLGARQTREGHRRSARVHDVCRHLQRRLWTRGDRLGHGARPGVDHPPGPAPDLRRPHLDGLLGAVGTPSRGRGLLPLGPDGLRRRRRLHGGLARLADALRDQRGLRRPLRQLPSLLRPQPAALRPLRCGRGPRVDRNPPQRPGHRDRGQGLGGADGADPSSVRRTHAPRSAEVAVQSLRALSTSAEEPSRGSRGRLRHRHVGLRRLREAHGERGGGGEPAARLSHRAGRRRSRLRPVLHRAHLRGPRGQRRLARLGRVPLLRGVPPGRRAAARGGHGGRGPREQRLHPHGHDPGAVSSSHGPRRRRPFPAGPEADPSSIRHAGQFPGGRRHRADRPLRPPLHPARRRLLPGPVPRLRSHLRGSLSAPRPREGRTRPWVPDPLRGRGPRSARGPEPRPRGPGPRDRSLARRSPGRSTGPPRRRPPRVGAAHLRSS